MNKIKKLKELKEKSKELQNEIKRLEGEIIEDMVKQGKNKIIDGNLSAVLVQYHKYSKWNINTVKRILSQMGENPDDFVIRKVTYDINKPELEKHGLLDKLASQKAFEKTEVKYIKLEELK